MYKYFLVNVKVKVGVKFSQLSGTMWVGPLLHGVQASFHILWTHFWVLCLHPILWVMHPLHVHSFFPLVLVNSPFRSVLVIFAGCLASRKGVSWLWPPNSGKWTLSIRFCLTSSLNKGNKTVLGSWVEKCGYVEYQLQMPILISLSEISNIFFKLKF